MPIKSVGVDIVEIDRIENLLEKYGEKFLKRIFSEKEIAYCSKKKDRGSYAARFATKEAVFKATGLGLGKGMTWKDIEVINDEKGKPSVRLYGKTAEMLNNTKVHLSISHSRDAAVAMVIVEN
ncbi:MAG: holo-ACP synthase [Calditrichaeota bacterium]|nr:holo-ACP synthase [Calditrichota bacterium]